MSVLSLTSLLLRDTSSMLPTPSQPHLHLRHLPLIYIHNTRLLPRTYLHTPTPTPPLVHLGPTTLIVVIIMPLLALLVFAAGPSTIMVGCD